MSTVKYTAPCKLDGTAGSETAIAAADFNALADGALVLGPELDNSTNKYSMARIQFLMTTSTVSPSDGAQFVVYVIPANSDGSYPGGEAGNAASAANHPPLSYVRGAIGFRSKATQSVSGTCDVPVPQGKFKFALRNSKVNGTSALPASSTNMVCTAQFYSTEVV